MSSVDLFVHPFGYTCLKNSTSTKSAFDMKIWQINWWWWWKGRKLYEKNSREDSDSKFPCLRAIKTKHYSQRLPIVGTVGYNIESYWDLRFKQLGSPVQHLSRKGADLITAPGIDATTKGTATQLGLYLLIVFAYLRKRLSAKESACFAYVQRHWLQGARGTCPQFYRWLGTVGTVSRRTANKKLTKLYWPSRERSPKRLIVRLETKSGGARPKKNFRRLAMPPP